MRRIVVGDVHGCYNELVTLLDKINLNKEEDELIFLGDYTDRGPDSYKVFLFLKTLKEEMKERCTFLMGNHEVFALESIRYGKTDDKRLWMFNGGSMTLDSFEEDVSKEESKNRLKAYADFVEENTIMLYECDDFLACHAGLLNDEDPHYLAKSDPDLILWDREAFRGGFYNGKICFVGHTPIPNPMMMVRKNLFDADVINYENNTTYDLPSKGLLGIDTCCFRTNNLTAAIVENKKVTFVW